MLSLIKIFTLHHTLFTDHGSCSTIFRPNEKGTPATMTTHYGVWRIKVGTM